MSLLPNHSSKRDIVNHRPRLTLQFNFRVTHSLVWLDIVTNTALPSVHDSIVPNGSGMFPIKSLPPPPHETCHLRYYLHNDIIILVVRTISPFWFLALHIAKAAAAEPPPPFVLYFVVIVPSFHFISPYLRYILRFSFLSLCLSLPFYVGPSSHRNKSWYATYTYKCMIMPTYVHRNKKQWQGRGGLR